MRAQELIQKAYGTSRNFMTPEVEAVRMVRPGLAVEISTGRGIFSPTLVGLTFADADGRRNDLSCCLQAESYQDGLRLAEAHLAEVEA